MSPVTLARHSTRGRLLRRVVALAALGLFVAGMLVAAGFGTLVVKALPVAAAALVATVAAWLLWWSRPWRVVRPAAGGVAHATATLARLMLRLARATRSSVAGTVAATPTAMRAASTWLEEFLARPREPWRPPPWFYRARASLTALMLRTDAVRRHAHRAWRALGAGVRRRILRAVAALGRQLG